MTNQAAQTMPELPVALASIHADGYWTTDDRRPDWKWPARQRVFSVDQMHQYARDYAAMLAAAPAASGGEVWTREMIADVHKRGEELFQRINPQAAAPVSERAQEKIATMDAATGGESCGCIYYGLGKAAPYLCEMHKARKADPHPPPAASVSERARELVRRAYEVVHHDDECPAIGGCGDKDCRCDAVPFLRELESLISGGSHA